MNEFLTAVAAAIDGMDPDGIEERIQACLRNGIEPKRSSKEGSARDWISSGRNLRKESIFSETWSWQEKSSRPG